MHDLTVTALKSTKNFDQKDKAKGVFLVDVLHMDVQASGILPLRGQKFQENPRIFARNFAPTPEKILQG